MTAFYYIKGEGGIGREFVVFDEDEDADHSYGDFKLYKKDEVDLGDLDCSISLGSHYLKDT